MIFCATPNLKQLQEIKEWLLKEDKVYNTGFYCNWNIIEQSFHKGLLLSLDVDGKAIGFVVWSKFDKYIELDIMEIHPKYRNQGLGSLFFKEVEKFFTANKFMAIKLFCSPEESESFWQKMDFIKFPYRGYDEPELTYYKPLIEVEDVIDYTTDNKLELWELEPYQIKSKSPKWTWQINKAHKPILQPCNPNWNLRLTLDGKIIKEDKVKYFSKNIEAGPFLFIEKELIKGK